VIEHLGHDRKDRAFVLVFQADEGDDYRSEVYYPDKGQKTKSAAIEICRRYGWLEFPPANGILTREELLELDSLVDDAIHDMDARPERYVPDPEKAWRDMFDWSDDAQEFYMDGNDLLACGDPPIPSQDCDLDSGWTHYNYAHDIYRVIPASVKDRGQKHYKASMGMSPRKGPRGIEVISFSSGDMDGNWDTEAQFVRHQKGVKLTEEDRERCVATGKANEEARDAYNKASKEDSNYGDLWRAWCKAGDAHKLAKTLRFEDLEEEYWDPEEFRYYAVQMNCYWTLLRYKRYEIWCALHGEDPLGNVHHERAETSATFDVTASTNGGKTEITAVLVKGDAELEKEALDYMGKHTVAEIKKILKENPKGRPIKEDKDRFGLRKGWVPGKVTASTITFRVSMAGSITLPLTPLRIRKVSCKGLAEDVKRMMHQIDKHYPQPA
jgi:hypothetical protein